MLVMYGLLQQTANLRNVKQVDRKVRHENDIRKTLLSQTTDANEYQEALTWANVQLKCIRHVQNSIEHTKF